MTDAKPPTMVVHKYKLQGLPGELHEIELPKGASILRVAGQELYVDENPEFFLWALICKDVVAKEKRKWLSVCTGCEFSAKALADLAWIGVQRQESGAVAHGETAITRNGRLVLHFWISHPIKD